MAKISKARGVGISTSPVRRGVMEFASYCAEKEFGAEYRGYEFKGLRWTVAEGSREGDFSIQAFMPNSPIHPLDMVCHNQSDVPLDPSTIELHVREAVNSLKSIIDSAYENPGSFKSAVAVWDSGENNS